jgi:flagellar export protein FliJ
MADIFKHLERLRNHEKRQARIKLADAETDKHEAEDALDANRQRVDEIRQGVIDNDPQEVARYHAFRLRMEMHRRTESGKLSHAVGRVDTCRTRLNLAIRRAQTMEKLIQNRADEAAREARKNEATMLDELGLQGWWRNSA